MSNIVGALICFIIFPLSGICQNSVPSKKVQETYLHTPLNKMTEQKFKAVTNNVPDSIVLNPIQFVNTYVFLDTADFEFDEISVDVNVKTSIPLNYEFFIVPLCGNINSIPFYSGLISGDQRKGMFTRWMERNIAALKTKGEFSSDDKEGDGIQITNSFGWDKGKYRITLAKSGYVKGMPIPPKYQLKDLMFSWGKYEHTWLTMSVQNLTTGERIVIGSLAFPGRILHYSLRNIIFLEHYGSAINFAAKWPKYQYAVINKSEVPLTDLDISNFRINKLQAASILFLGETGYMQ